MLRRILLGAFAIVTVAGFAPNARPDVTLAAPSSTFNVSQIQFASQITSDADPINPRIEFGNDESTIWAVVDFFDRSAGADLSYVLRLNDGDYAFGDIRGLGDRSSGRFALALRRPTGSDKDLPGGAYRFLLYEGDREVAQAGFGIRGTQGSDNDGEGNSNGNDND